MSRTHRRTPGGSIRSARPAQRASTVKVRQFLAWLADTHSDGDPLGVAAARDWAVRDYRTHLQAVLKRKPATVNNALAAIDDLYIRRGLGPASAARADLPVSAPKALSRRAAVRFLRAVEACPSPRDQVIALIPFYAGTRIAEIVGLDVDDVGRSSRGARLSARGAHDIITAIAHNAGLDDDTTTHVLRHTFATHPVRGGTDLVIAAELLGHARLETPRVYTRPTDEDRANALNLLDVDE